MPTKELSIQKKRKKGRRRHGDVGLKLAGTEAPGLMVAAWTTVRRLVVEIERPRATLSRNTNILQPRSSGKFLKPNVAIVCSVTLDRSMMVFVKAKWMRIRRADFFSEPQKKIHIEFTKTKMFPTRPVPIIERNTVPLIMTRHIPFFAGRKSLDLANTS